MFIRANHFDYQKLLEAIITLGDFKDEIVTDKVILRVFKNFEVAYKEQIKKDVLTPTMREICNFFFISIGTPSEQDMDDAEDDPDYDPYKRIAHMDEIVSESLKVLEGVLEGGDLETEIEASLSWFADYVTSHSVVSTSENDPGWCYVFGDEIIREDDFVNVLTGWLEVYAGNQLSGLNQYIYSALNENLLPRELVTDITVIDLPGNKVVHGNALITFPIILLEVFDL